MRTALTCGASMSVWSSVLSRLYDGGGMCLVSRWRRTTTTIPHQIARLKVNGLIERKKRVWGIQRGGRSWTVRLCARPSTARQKVSNIYARSSFIHLRQAFIAYSCVISAADDRAVSESADAYCQISGNRVSPQLVVGSPPHAIG